MMQIFLLLCQIQGGEITQCSPPSGMMQPLTVAGWKPPGPTWQIEWPTWGACIAEARRKNLRVSVGQGESWAFMCYATGTVGSGGE